MQAKLDLSDICASRVISVAQPTDKLIAVAAVGGVEMRKRAAVSTSPCLISSVALIVADTIAAGAGNGGTDMLTRLLNDAAQGSR